MNGTKQTSWDRAREYKELLGPRSVGLAECRAALAKNPGLLDVARMEHRAKANGRITTQFVQAAEIESPRWSNGNTSDKSDIEQHYLIEMDAAVHFVKMCNSNFNRAILLLKKLQALTV